jgi:hypothetical protein
MWKETNTAQIKSMILLFFLKEVWIHYVPTVLFYFYTDEIVPSNSFYIIIQFISNQ